MDTVVSIVVLLALAAPVGIAAAWFTGQGPDALASLFRGDRGLGWPHGVQEEDPPAWNWEPPARPPGGSPAGDDVSTIVDGGGVPAIEPVAFRVGRRAPRGRR